MNQYLHHTTAWIKDFVIQYQLCPFAAQPFQEDRIKYVLFEGSDVEALVEKTFLEAFYQSISLSDDPSFTRGECRKSNNFIS